MALISIVLIVFGFILNVYAGVVLSLSKSIQAENGEVKQGKVSFLAILLSVGTLCVMAGTLGYYALRMNLPYYVNGAFGN